MRCFSILSSRQLMRLGNLRVATTTQKKNPIQHSPFPRMDHHRWYSGPIQGSHYRCQIRHHCYHAELKSDLTDTVTGNTVTPNSEAMQQNDVQKKWLHVGVKKWGRGWIINKCHRIDKGQTKKWLYSDCVLPNQTKMMPHSKAGPHNAMQKKIRVVG